MSKVTITFIVLYFFITQSTLGQQLPTRNSLSNQSKQILREFEIGFKNPTKYIRSDKLETLFTLLLNNPNFSQLVISTDSIALILNYPKADRFFAVKCLVNIAIFTQNRNLNLAIAGNALLDAAKTLLIRINRPEDALLLYQLGSSSGLNGMSENIELVNTYLIRDKFFEKILYVNWYTLDKKDKLKYSKKLKKYLNEHPNTLLKPKIEKILGDIYYSLNQYRPMKKWYKRAIASDPFLKDNTPAGYRIIYSNKQILRQNILVCSHILIYTVYITILIVILPNIIRAKKKFNLNFFITKTFFFSLIFIGISYFTFKIDFNTTSHVIQSVLKDNLIIKTPPVISFSAMDLSFFPDCIIIFALGFIPLFTIIFLQSFHNTFSKPFLISIVLLLTLSIWGHYILSKTFNYTLYKDSLITKSHIYFDGELENLLLKKPKKILQTKPDIANTDNSDLINFLHKNFPDGIENYDKDTTNWDIKRFLNLGWIGEDSF